MLVRLAGLVAVLQKDGVGRRHLAGVGEGKGRGGGDDLGGDAGLLADLAEDGLDGVLVGLDVAAGRHPLLERLVPVEEGAGVLDDEAGGGEVAPHCWPAFTASKMINRAMRK